MTPHGANLNDLVSQLSTDPENGLTTESAEARLTEHGENRLIGKAKKANLQRFLDQFRDAMILILMAAALISLVTALREGHAGGFVEPALIMAIVVLNAIMGVLQENKAEKSLDALKKLSAPRARVRRDGRDQSLDAALLVPGDLILLEAGDFVPADARLVRTAILKSDESALTGESVPVEKSADAIVADDALLADRSNMIHSGCSVTYGRATAIVTATGMQTEMGRIATLLTSEGESATPLQVTLANLGKQLGIAALAICAVIFAIGVADGLPVVELFMTAVSLAVSAIPEGLPAIVTIVLSIGVQRMVQRNAIIRRLPAVETLGSASVICSDKTGTLTQNRMTLVTAYADGMEAPEAISSENSEPVRRLLEYGTLCSDGRVEIANGEEHHIGDPTETAIVLAAYRNGVSQVELRRIHPRLAEIPFDSSRKLMTTVNRIDNRNTVIVKGAFDVLASRCVKGDLARAAEIVEQLSSSALRVIAIARKETESISAQPTPDELESGLTFVGLVGMIDPPRPEAREAVKTCRRAGIRPVMITGDHVATASAIARDLGILTAGGGALTGAELATMSDGELDRRVERVSVYARVSPEDKTRIVRAWQRRGQIVAMTGDGVNDAPALKAADIGCAMGITGTDVAKGSADMILTDDNFSTIVVAVREGRGIYDNIRKVVAFLLGTNIGEVLTVFLAMILWRRTPLLSTQLLWINLVTDSLPAIALGMEAVTGDIMARPPKAKQEGIFAHHLGLQVILQGAMFAALTLYAFWHGWRVTGLVTGGQTMAFIVLALTQVVHAFSMRSQRSLFRLGAFSNRSLNGATVVAVVLMAFATLVPGAATAFGLMRLPSPLYLKAIGLALVPLPVMEAVKALSGSR